MASNPILHHIGYVVDSIPNRIESFRASVNATAVSQSFHDPIQRTRVIFLEMAPPVSVLLELIEPAGATSPVAHFLSTGGGLHHLCYEVDDLARQISWMKSLNAMLIRSPQPAVAFAGRRIAWVRTRESLLIEYLERKPVGPTA